MAKRKSSGWGGARPGSGGKPKAVHERQRNVVRVLLTDEERAQLERRVQHEGTSLSGWLRGLVLRELRRRR